MKPYTLRWWMEQLYMVSEMYHINRVSLNDELEGNPVNEHHRRMCLKYMNLRDFIFDRIINKYGEND